MLAWHLILYCCLLAVVLPRLVSAQTTPACPNENEQWRCSNTCQDRCIDISRVCTRECYFGCFCIRGFRRNEDGTCIPEEECPKGKCRENEVESKCVCDRYCKDQGIRPTCPIRCIVGCACITGYVRNGDGNCIPEKKCPKVDCPKNETNVDCINHCNLCPRLKKECVKGECVPGCDCEKGYFRDSQGHCVLKEDCETHDTDCPKNETHVDCIKNCNVCPLLRPRCEKGSPCSPGCDCLPKYFRDRQGHCVLEEDCVLRN